jgi:hypothetical protein
MFYKCTCCQAEHEPPRLPASNILTHCPTCGQPVTLIQHDTVPPPGAPDPVHVTALGAVQSFCAECGGKYINNAKGELERIDHGPDCSELSERTAPGRLDVEPDSDDGLAGWPKMPDQPHVIEGNPEPEPGTE